MLPICSDASDQKVAKVIRQFHQTKPVRDGAENQKLLSNYLLAGVSFFFFFLLDLDHIVVNTCRRYVVLCRFLMKLPAGELKL
ncbi:hypothetical protein HanIR_Chr14g0676861 [Helianthus annuus]|nr:hypothetical protein HanIR_Chr14g0676861 [Helianthus annuus]